MSETVTEKTHNYVPVIEAKPEPKSVVDYISEPRKLDAPRADATPEELYNELIRIYRSYKPEGDTELIKKASEVACRQHKDQK